MQKNKIHGGRSTDLPENSRTRDRDFRQGGSGRSIRISRRILSLSTPDGTGIPLTTGH